MAVTSPLAPLSPLRAVGRGNLCCGDAMKIYIMQGQKYMTRHRHLQYIDTNALSICWVCWRCCTNPLKYSKNTLLLNLTIPSKITSLTFQAEKQQIQSTNLAPFLTFPDWSVIVLAPSSCIALHQRGGGLVVFNSISGYPCCCCCCCCSFWQTNSCHQH